MNHCIPDRRLQPLGAKIYQGLVVTEPLGGNVEHYVLLNQQCILFAMPAHLFECTEQKVKNTRRLRLEKLLEFGDSIIFTCDFNRHVVLDYEKTCKVDETMCENGKFLIKTLCILSPSVKDSCIWTNIFGKFVMNAEEIFMVRQQIIPDVPVYAWFEICIVDNDGLPTMRPKLYKFVDDGGVNTEDRTIVWDTDWRRGTQQIHFSGDDDSDLDEFIEKPEDELYQLKVGLEGVVINDFEIFSPSYRDERIFMGCWRMEDVKRRPLGSRIFFDMMLSDLAGWVVYYYTRNRGGGGGGVSSADDAEHGEPPLYAVEKNDINAERRFGSEPDFRTYISINVRIMDFNLSGFYLHEYFGLVTDGLQLLRCLPYACEDLKRVWVDVVDIGPGRMARFEIAKLPLYVSELVEEAEEKMRNEEIHGEGFLLNNRTGQLYAYKYSNVHFFFNEEKVHLATGTWCEFWANYVSDATFIIVRHKVLYDRPPLDCARVDGPSEGPIKYEFKIPVEYHKSYKKLLFYRYCGFVADPHNKFKPSFQFKRADVIVEQDTARDATTLFKIKRMAKKNERLSKVKVGLIVEVDDAATNSSDGAKKPSARKSAAAVDGDDELDLGLPMGSVCDPSEEEDVEAEAAYVEERQLSNVEFNSKYSIRERKLMARQRKLMRERQTAQNERTARLNTSGKT